MRTPEGSEKSKICAYLDAVPYCWYFKPQAGPYGKRGIPDIVGSFRGLFFAIEVKRPGKKLTKLQESQLYVISQSGGKCFWGTAEKVCKEFIAWRSSGATRSVTY